MSLKHLREYDKWNVLFTISCAALIFFLVGGLFNLTFGNIETGKYLMGLSVLSCVSLFIIGIKRNGIRRRVKWSNKHEEIVREAKRIHESKSA
ncbi:hypothetical protein [Bacteriovorax sp. DB6_IX]|uniref:hypothetical protein n=1 Tax=Bacteriovorax sp. DB6_IX TaxID=1353530 RepID=UPI00038A362D|nr:hypothetical protein [Bacteriovorax sp. DB6_IX]EQC49846.1 hypothetical protein M901_2413 [Bacteriovorax sp. DB6_IX]